MKWRLIGGPPERWFNGLGLGHGFTEGGGRGDGRDGYGGDGYGNGGGGNVGNSWSPRPGDANYEYFVAVEEES